MWWSCCMGVRLLSDEAKFGVFENNVFGKYID